MRIGTLLGSGVAQTAWLAARAELAKRFVEREDTDNREDGDAGNVGRYHGLLIQFASRGSEGTLGVSGAFLSGALAAALKLAKMLGRAP